MTQAMEGKIKKHNPKSYHRQSRKAVLERCQICGRNDTKLHVHHIDKDPMNNAADNLITLCGSCHRRSHSPNYTDLGRKRKLCKFCSTPSYRGDLCSKHQQRLRKYGNPYLTKRQTKSGWKLVAQA